MIISWNTDPSHGNFTEGSTIFSSYYQYDTVSRNLVRIRLELGRTEDLGQTQVIFDKNRAVGFSDIDFIAKQEEYPDEDFTIDAETGELLVKGVPLSQVPKSGYNVVDMSNGDEVPHFGSSVSTDANFPEGISNKHLSVLANAAVLEEKGYMFTQSNASAAELSEAIKAQVGRIVGKAFAEITDADLLQTLQKQVARIRENEILPSKESMDSSLIDVDELLESVRSQITDEGLVPTEDFEKAFQDLSDKVKAAQDASESGTGMKDAIAALSKSKESFNVEAAKLEARYYDALKDQVAQSDKAIETALSDAEDWEFIEAEYENLEDASSIEEYENEIGVEESEVL